MHALSSTKGGIYVPECNFSAPLYPLSVPPSQWAACEDAYTFTWMADPDGHIAALSLRERERLARSMGFCPHRRCQLHTLSGASSGLCPAGLCYTKVEYGSPSFGACCFVDGVFDWGDLVGHEAQCQTQPKPIYKKNRVVLGEPLSTKGRSARRRQAAAMAERETETTESVFENGERQVNASQFTDAVPLTVSPHNHTPCVTTQCRHGSEFSPSTLAQSPHTHTPSFLVTERLSPRDRAVSTDSASFVNANMVLPDLIVTQCVMRSTAADVLRMIEQERIELWIQLSHPSQVHLLGDSVPSSSQSELPPSEAKKKAKAEDCYLLTDALREFADNERVTTERIPSNREDVMEHHRVTISTPVGENEESDKHVLEFIWFKEWDDFKIPPAEFEQDVRDLSFLASHTLSHKGVIAINCHSGRGRSGTLAAIVSAAHYGVSDRETLVSLIVSMRESRDGLVETPEQFRFAARMLGLGDTATLAEPHISTLSSTQSVAHTETHRFQHASEHTPHSSHTHLPASTRSLPSQVEMFGPLLCVLGLCVVLLCVWKKESSVRRGTRSPVPKRYMEP